MHGQLRAHGVAVEAQVRHPPLQPGLTQGVLEQASAGAELATLTPETVATVVGGPKQMPGDSDTIVWHEVQMEDGVTGWVAANTSTYALLELAD